MTDRDTEIKRRTEAALAVIKGMSETHKDVSAVRLFVSHHRDAIDQAYWQKHLGMARPTPSRMLDVLVLRSHWSAEDDDGIDNFDFTLPDAATQYVICVRFDQSGQIEGLYMES